MKKTLLYALAIVAIFAACSKEANVDVIQDAQSATEIDTPNVGRCYLNATYETPNVPAQVSPETKASLADDGTFAWVSGDSLAVYNSSDSKYYVFTTTDSGSSATFSRDVVSGSNWTLAYYPASIVMSKAEIEAGVSSSTVASTSTITLKDTYTAAQAARAFPMTGTVDGSSLSMKHLGALMRFKFKNVPYQATKMVLEMSSGISGAFSVSGSPAEITATGTGKTTVTFDKGTTSTISIPVPTATYTSFTVTFKDANNNELFAKVKTGLSYVVSRANICASSSALNAQGEEFYLIHEGNGWSLSGNAARFLKTGSNTYAVAGYAVKQKNGESWNERNGFKVINGYYKGKVSVPWSNVYGQTGSRENSTGTLVFGGSNNCGSGWSGEDRLYIYTINMSTLAFSATDNGSWWTGANEMYYMSGETGFEWTKAIKMTKITDFNWKLSSVSVAGTGSKEFKFFEEKDNWNKHWQGTSVSLSNSTPYGTMDYLGTGASGNGAHYDLSAGTYDIYFNSGAGYVWFVPTGE